MARFMVTLYKAVRKSGIDDEKIVDLSTHTSEEKAVAKVGAINNALGLIEDDDGWFSPKEGDLFAMYE